MTQNLVSIIILTSRWGDQGKILDRCLQGIYRQSFREFEIILVTNGLDQSHVNEIKNRHPTVRIIENEENKGCAGGRNQGIKEARGRYIVTLDDDMVPDSKWLEELMRFKSRDEGIGMLASKVLFSSSRDIIDCAGVEISKDGNVYGRMGLTIDEGGSDQVEEVFCPSGGAAFYKREVFEDVGLFDEDYFIYYEEVDLAFRARLAGWRCLYVPRAIVFHHHAWSLGHESSRKIFLLERNKILTILKDWPIRYILYYAPLIVAYDILADGYYILKKKDISRFKAKISALKQLPRVLRERSRIQSNRRITYAEMDRFWGPYYSPWFIYKRRCRLDRILQEKSS